MRGEETRLPGVWQAGWTIQGMGWGARGGTGSSGPDDRPGQLEEGGESHAETMTPLSSHLLGTRRATLGMDLGWVVQIRKGKPRKALCLWVGGKAQDQS